MTCKSSVYVGRLLHVMDAFIITRLTINWESMTEKMTDLKTFSNTPMYVAVYPRSMRLHHSKSGQKIAETRYAKSVLSNVAIFTQEQSSPATAAALENSKFKLGKFSLPSGVENFE